jgi:hypothetical protein
MQLHICHSTIYIILYDRKVKWHSSRTARMAVGRCRACYCEMSAVTAAEQAETNA